MKYLVGVLSCILIFSSTAYAQDGVTRMEYVRHIFNEQDITLSGVEVKDMFDEDLAQDDLHLLNTAYTLSIVSGFDDNSFRPNDLITEEQALAMTLRAKGVSKEALAESSDSGSEILGHLKDEVSEWAKPYVVYAVKNGIIERDLFRPKGTAQSIDTLFTQGNASSSTRTESAESSKSASQILIDVESNVQQQRTFEMKGSIDVEQIIDIDGQVIENKYTILHESINELPDRSYNTTSTNIMGLEIYSEAFIDGDKLHIMDSISGEWQTVELPNMSDFEKTLSGANSSNILSYADIEKMQDNIRFGDTVVIDGQEHYTIIVEIGADVMAELMAGMTEQYSATLRALNSEMSPDSLETSLELVEQALNAMHLEMLYEYFINKETLLPKKFNLEMEMVLALQVEDSTINTIDSYSGSYEYFNFGKDVVIGNKA